jgi:hypothetical protein
MSELTIIDGGLTEREQELIETLNEWWRCLDDFPLLSKFNRRMKACAGELVSLEQDCPKIGIPSTGDRITTLSLISTITDILTDKRLAAQVDDDGRIVGWSWHPGSPKVAEFDPDPAA